MTRCFLVLSLISLLAACAPPVERKFDTLSTAVKAEESAAVTWIYDSCSGDVTALGDYFRDKVEKELNEDGIVVKARREIGVIIEDIESFGSGGSEAEVWEKAGADLLVTGTYSFTRDAQGRRAARLTIKVLRVSDSSLVDSFIEDTPLPSDWAQLSAQVKGNVYQEEVETLVDTSSSAGPKLAVSLDRNPACYPSGTPGRVKVETFPGSHVYLLNLAADRTVTLLYPNSIMQDQPLPTGKLQFPPAALEDDVQLVFYPLDERETINEGIKVIASKYPLDFSFLPIPENAIYAGAEGGDIRKVSELLKENFGWSEKVVDYWVGPDCE